MELASSVATATSSKPRLNLNKRVAFPMQSSAVTSSSNVKTTAEGLPLPFSTAKYNPTIFDPSAENDLQKPLPPPAFPPSAVNSTEIVSDKIDSTPDADSSCTFDSKAAQEYCYLTFVRLVDAMESSVDANKTIEIRKRLDILNDMWNDNKFDEGIQKTLHSLAEGKGCSLDISRDYLLNNSILLNYVCISVFIFSFRVG